jgi:Right handed beta helix region
MRRARSPSGLPGYRGRQAHRRIDAWAVICAGLMAALPVAWPSDAAQAPAPSAATVVVHPGEDVAALVAGAPGGTRFRFAAGTYRLLEIVPKDADAFIGDPGAILSGARIVAPFRQEAGLYVADVSIELDQDSGSCQPGRVCNRTHDVFLAGERLEPVLFLGAVGPGKFFIDYRDGKLYLGSDPTGRIVELATARYAFASPAANVLIRGLRIEKYANPAQTGAVGGDARTQGSSGRPVHWSIVDCDIRDNHGVGVELGNDSRISGSRIERNGQLGIGAAGSHLVVDHNEIANNNQAGYVPGWEAGGLKLAFSIHALIEANFVHDNHGAGLWADIDSVDTVYEDNRVVDNDDTGIQHEISFDAVIRGNEVHGNGRTPHHWGWGAQILVQNSRDVTVEGNRVTVADGGNGIILIEQRRELGPFGPHLVRDCTVRNNNIEMAGAHGWAAGLLTDYAASTAAAGNNRFDADNYRVTRPDGRFWTWPGGSGAGLDFATFQRQFGQETTGRITAVSP